MTIYGPLSTLRRAFNSGSYSQLVNAVESFLTEVECGYYDSYDKPVFTPAEDFAMRAAYGSVPLEIMCDSFECSMHDLCLRLRMNGIKTENTYDETHLESLIQMYESKISETEACEQLSLVPPPTLTAPPAPVTTRKTPEPTDECINHMNFEDK